MLMLLFLLQFSLAFLLLLIRDYIYNKRRNLLMAILIMQGYRKAGTNNNTSIVFEKNNIYIHFVRDSMILVISKHAKVINTHTIFISVKKLLLEDYNA